MVFKKQRGAFKERIGQRQRRVTGDGIIGRAGHSPPPPEPKTWPGGPPHISLWVKNQLPKAADFRSL